MKIKIKTNEIKKDVQLSSLPEGDGHDEGYSGECIT
jgi:hypothetical protein